MMRPGFEYRIRSARTHHVTALADRCDPASVARIAEELSKLAFRRDPTAVLEVRRRTPQRPPPRRRKSV